VVSWTEATVAFGVFLLLVAVFAVNAYLVFRDRRSLVVFLLFTLPLSWFVTIVLLLD